MDWRIRLFVFKNLEKLPVSIGTNIYHLVQEFKGRIKPEKLYDGEYKSLEEFTRLCNDELFYQDKSVMEIGSGWMPMTPYILTNRYDAAEVNTFDITKHYNNRRIKKLNKYFEQSELKDQLDNRINYYPYFDLSSQTFNVRPDIVYSRNVLEHVEPFKIRLIHENIFKLLKNGGRFIHQISPSDHRAYYDKNLGLYDFLKYSEEEWSSLHTKFDYHNRLRLPEYLKIFSDCGLEVLQLKYSYGNNQNLPKWIDDRFSGYSEEELKAGNIRIVLKKK